MRLSVRSNLVDGSGDKGRRLHGTPSRTLQTFCLFYFLFCLLFKHMDTNIPIEGVTLSLKRACLYMTKFDSLFIKIKTHTHTKLPHVHFNSLTLLRHLAEMILV